MLVDYPVVVRSSATMEHTRYPPDSPAGMILCYLQRHARATVKELADLLGVSTTAVRDHLVHLQAEDMVEVTSERNGPVGHGWFIPCRKKRRSPSPNSTIA